MSTCRNAYIVATVCVLGCATIQIPEDAASFMERRRTCDHFRGEDPYSPERRVEIELAAEKYCRGTDRELAELRSKYRDNVAVLRALEQFENDIEAK